MIPTTAPALTEACTGALVVLPADVPVTEGWLENGVSLPAAEEYNGFTISEIGSTSDKVECGDDDDDATDVDEDDSSIETSENGNSVEGDCKACV